MDKMTIFLLALAIIHIVSLVILIFAMGNAPLMPEDDHPCAGCLRWPECNGVEDCGNRGHYDDKQDLGRTLLPEPPKEEADG